MKRRTRRRRGRRHARSSSRRSSLGAVREPPRLAYSTVTLLARFLRLVDVAAAADGDVIREQLQRHHHQHRCDQRMRVWDRDQEVIGRIEQLLDPVLILAREDDHRSASRLRFLDIPDHLLEHVVVRRDRDDRHLLVDQRDRTVLHLAGRIAFGVDVGDLLQLQRAFERDRIVDAAAEEQEVAALVEPLARSPRSAART